jgi:hypothetical protein
MIFAPRFIAAAIVPIWGSFPLPMAFDPVLFRQLPLIQKIIADETWLESERRGCAVPSDDPAVRENVCRVVLAVGAAMRDALTLDLAHAPQKLPPDHSPQAA